MHRNKAWWLSLILVGLLWWAGTGRALAHAQYDHSNPASNSSLPTGQPPTQVKVWFTEGVEPKFSKLSVLDKDGKPVDRGDSHLAPGDDMALIVSLPPGLPDGAYTVVYENVSADDGHQVKSSFSFAVGNAPLPLSANTSLLDSLDTSDADANFNPWSVIVRWLNYLTMAALAGLVLFWLIVWRPSFWGVKGRLNIDKSKNDPDYFLFRRLNWLIGASLTLLTVGWLAWLVYQATVVSSRPVWQIFKGRTLDNLLFGSRFGLVWLVRLALIVAAWGFWLYLRNASLPDHWDATRYVRKPRAETGADPLTSESVVAVEAPPQPDVVVSRLNWSWWVLLGLALAIILTTSLNSHAAADKLAWALVPNDWLHLVGMAVWVGGLIALVGVLPVALGQLKPGSGDRTRLLAAVVPRFSRLALIAVAVLLLTGTIQAVVQIGTLESLFKTSYGLALLVKLILFAILIGLGAFNLRLVSPRLKRLARYRPKDDSEQEIEKGAGSLAAGQWQRRFRLSTRLEIGLMVAVLIAAGSLTSLPPPKTEQAANILVERGQAGNLSYVLAVSPARLGENQFEVELKDSSGAPVTARTVELRLTMLDMAMGAPQQTPLKPEAARPGRYTAVGSVLSMTGRWEATLFVQRDGQEDVNAPVYFEIGK